MNLTLTIIFQLITNASHDSEYISFHKTYQIFELYHFFNPISGKSIPAGQIKIPIHFHGNKKISLAAL